MDNSSIWIKTLLQQLDDNVDQATLESVLGACGETCPFTHLSDDRLLEIKAHAENDSDFLDQLCRHWRMEKEKGHYYVVFDQCYCPLVNADPEGASKSLCYCTLGNLRHKFEIGLDQDFEIEMLKTILSGDDTCRFHIKLKNI